MSDRAVSISTVPISTVWSVAATFPLLLAAVGCQQSEFPLVCVAGTVTFDGASCPAPGEVTFQPLEIAEGMPKRPATGHFDTNGHYAVNTFSDSKGVLPGRYKVEVTCLAGGPDLSSPDPWGAVDYIAESYQPTELTVEPDGGSVVYDIDVPRRERTGP